MNKIGYPKEITEDNIQQLKERAIRIKRKAFWLTFFETILYGIIGIVTMPFIFFYTGMFLSNVLPEMPSSI